MLLTTATSAWYWTSRPAILFLVMTFDSSLPLAWSLATTPYVWPLWILFSFRTGLLVASAIWTHAITHVEMSFLSARPNPPSQTTSPQPLPLRMMFSST